MRLYLAGTVQYVSIGPRRTVHDQPVLRGSQNGAAGTTIPAASPRPLNCSSAWAGHLIGQRVSRRLVSPATAATPYNLFWPAILAFVGFAAKSLLFAPGVNPAH